ncbi:MAG TPA: DUF6754 domain-containing protein [Anaerolineales bacterium]|nr:DUF6754 domain-containing protein [Anaerolineales bacterium]
MSSESLGTSNFIGLLFVLLFLGLIIFFAISGRKKTFQPSREISAFVRLRRVIGLAVESGKRLHIALGRGGITGIEGASAVVGLTVLERIARVASVSDRPPIATSGDGILGILSQDTLRKTFKTIGAEGQYDPRYGQVSGLTSMGYAAGSMPVFYDEQVAATVFAGHFGSEVALMTEAAMQSDVMTLAGSDNLPAQAVMYATSEQPLVGEELYATGAYLKAGPVHLASLRAHDILRWVLVLAIIIGAALKFLGFL